MSISHFFSQSSSVQTEQVRDKGSITECCFLFNPPIIKRCLYLGIMSWALILLVWGQGVIDKTDIAFLHLLYNVVTDVFSSIMELTRQHAMWYYWWWMPIISTFSFSLLYPSSEYDGQRKWECASMPSARLCLKNIIQFCHV